VNHYPHHIGDFDKATRHLTRIERSIYRDLIELYYDTEQMISLDQAVVCRKILARSSEESTAVEQTLNEFFTKTDNGWFHDRCNAEIEKYQSNNSQKAEAGRASAAAKALAKQLAINGDSTSVVTGVGTDVATNVKQTNNGASTNQEPRTKNQEPLTNIDNTVDSKTALLGFDDFWNAYDKKVEKPAAEKSWKRISPSQELIDQILIAASIYAESTPEKTFRKNPSTWLNNKCWLDEVIVRVAASPIKQATSTSFRERDAELARQRVAEISPRIAAKAPSFGGSFIESETSNVTSIASH
jgi:uncharacterized protein YdaU (DUF1376 family)